ncbi:MAG: hypothetical protein II882_06415 [Lachnospiraceae bacterium]|nr:hypothetical protein [Lachnospiraceae bacterium]
MPVFSILSLFSFVLGTGLSILVSRELSLGSGSSARNTFRSVLTVTCLIGLCFTAVGIFYPEKLTELFAGSCTNLAVKEQTAQYLRPILIGALPILLYDVLGTVALLGGASSYLKAASAALLIVNITGDLLAVMLNQGLVGIAAASALGYFAALVVILLYFFSKQALLRLGFCRPEPRVLKKTVAIGMPSGVIFICKILRPISVNFLILAFGTLSGLAALSVQYPIRYLPGALCSGIASAALMLTAVFTADYDVVSLKKENGSIVRWSFIGGSVTAAVLMLLSSPIVGIFTEDPELHSLGVRALLFYLPGIPFLALNSSIISCFQALGNKRASIIFVVFEYLVAPVSFAYILARRFGDLGIYASFSACEIFVTITTSVFLLISIIKKRSVLPKALLDISFDADLKIKIADQEQAIAASKQINDLCLEHGFSRKQAFHVALTAEELAINSLTHGFDDKKAHHLELRTMIAGDKLFLRLRDDGRPFNLTERYKMLNPDDPTRNHLCRRR